MEPQQETSLFDTNMDSVTQNHLLSVSKWTKFISVTVFVGAGLIVLLLALAGSAVVTQFSELTRFDSGGSLSLIVGIIAVAMIIVFVWAYFLFRASSLLKKGLQTRNSNDIAEGFKALRIFFIISFVFYVLGILGTVQSFA